MSGPARKKTSPLEKENARPVEEMKEKMALLEECRERKAQPLVYEDLYNSSLLSKKVSAFALFDTVQLNDTFLNIVNYADGSEESLPEGDGMCENMRSYSHVKDEERDGSKAPPSMGINSDEYKQYIKKCRAARKGGRTWKDDYLAFCIYVRAGATQIFTACVCGISP